MNLLSRLNWHDFSWTKIKEKMRAHKIISVVILIMVLSIGYYTYGKLTNTSGETKYVISAVQKGTIVSAVTGTGQVSASNQLDLKSKVSGDLVYLGVSVGQKVSAGTLIAQIDSRTAEADLTSAQIALAKLKQPADAPTILQSENTLADAVQANSKAINDLPIAYNNAFSTLSSSYIDITTVLSGLDSLFNDRGGYFYGNGGIISNNQTAINYRDIAHNNYYKAKQKRDLSQQDFNNLTRASATSSIDNAMTETYDTAKAVSQALSDAKTAVDFIKSQNPSPSTDTNGTLAQNNISGWNNTISTDLTSIATAQTNIQNAKNTIDSSARSIRENTASLAKLKSGADPLDIQAQELNVEQKQVALNNYYIRAPFDGTIAQIDVQVPVSISGGGAIATLITDNKLAEITLNEVDVAKVQVGQKVMLTFDALSGLTIAGTVSSVDQVGVVTQGVVNYTVKISFATQDIRVKPGMSVNASIQTNVRQDVIVVPSSAVKIQGNNSYVEKLDSSIGVTDSQGIASTVLPTRQNVTVGVSDDTSTEIISGLNVGDKIIIKTILPSTTKTASAPSLLGNTGGNRGGTGGGGATRGSAVGGLRGG